MFHIGTVYYFIAPIERTHKDTSLSYSIYSYIYTCCKHGSIEYITHNIISYKFTLIYIDVQAQGKSGGQKILCKQPHSNTSKAPRDTLAAI